MTEDTPSSLENYVNEMLSHIADELNIKEIIIKHGDLRYVYEWDTIKGRIIGFENSGKAIIAGMLLFSGSVLDDMEYVRQVIKDGLRQRSEAGIKVRQPLQSVTISSRFNITK